MRKGERELGPAAQRWVEARMLFLYPLRDRMSIRMVPPVKKRQTTDGYVAVSSGVGTDGETLNTAGKRD